MNFKDYKTNARYAEQINAGYSARLNGMVRDDIWLIKDDFQAPFEHGWDMADRHEQTNRSEK